MSSTENNRLTRAVAVIDQHDMEVRDIIRQDIEKSCAIYCQIHMVLTTNDSNEFVARLNQVDEPTKNLVHKIVNIAIRRHYAAMLETIPKEDQE
jgi:hypothetical protein